MRISDSITTYLLLGPPTPPSNPYSTPINATSILLAWGPPSNVWLPSVLSYVVVVRSRNGGLLYNVTLRELQLTISTPDPCDHYKATVTALCGAVTGADLLMALQGGTEICV